MKQQTNNKPIDLNITFKNVGKIDQATIKLRSFTVIAGCNSSGKSFITKSLYSLFSAMPDKELSKHDSKSITLSFLDNFMASSFSQLINHHADDNASISFKGMGDLQITKQSVLCDDSLISNLYPVNLHPPAYLESPIYWKLIDALESSQKSLSDIAKKRRLNDNQLVKQVPKYFFDVMELLEVQVKTTIFDDIVKKIEKAIQGNLAFSEGGIHFNDSNNNSTVNLSMTALGVTNLGMIALLLKRGAIMPGTFLFIDEPEVHLHPSWQVVLIDVLHELSKRGVNIVIASHSIDIMKAIENIMSSDKSIEQQEHFGINQLSAEGNSINDTDNNFKRIAAIKEDLGKPFYDMFIESQTL